MIDLVLLLQFDFYSSFYLYQFISNHLDVVFILTIFTFLFLYSNRLYKLKLKKYKELKKYKYKYLNLKEKMVSVNYSYNELVRQYNKEYLNNNYDELKEEYENMVIQKIKFKRKFLKMCRKNKNKTRKLNETNYDFLTFYNTYQNLYNQLLITSNNLKISTSQFDDLQNTYLQLYEKLNDLKSNKDLKLNENKDLKSKKEFDQYVSYDLYTKLCNIISSHNKLSEIQQNSNYEYKDSDLKLNYENNENNELLKVYISNEQHEKEIHQNNKGLKNILINLGPIRYIDKSKIKQDYTYYKVIFQLHFTRFVPFIGYLFDIHSSYYHHFKVESYEEGLSLISYLKTDLVKYLINAESIPLPPLDRQWNNESVYEFFGIDNELILYIKNCLVDRNKYS